MRYADAQTAVAAIEARRRHKKDLPAYRTFLAEVCPAAFDLPIIHVAGTNGKGSTVNYLRSLLQQKGLRVGTLTSPALQSHYDRIRIDDVWMDPEVFLSLVNRYEERWDTLELSMFDIDVHLAMEWFVSEQVDIVVLETGLGGRLDATNIFVPQLCVITNIGHDHMQLLGNTLEEIAWEKGGIIKEGIPLVTAEKNAGCLRVLEEICAQKHAPLIRSQALHIHRDDSGLVCFDTQSQRGLRLSTPALYQAHNAALALDAFCQLYPDLSNERKAQGLWNCGWAGRFQILWEHPMVIVDGAHNREGVEALCETLQDLPVDTIIFSVLKDKEADVMLTSLQKVCRRLILCAFEQERAADLKALADRFRLPLSDSLPQLLKERMATDDRIVICGSLYFVSEAVRLFDSKRMQKRPF